MIFWKTTSQGCLIVPWRNRNDRIDSPRKVEMFSSCRDVMAQQKTWKTTVPEEYLNLGFVECWIETRQNHWVVVSFFFNFHPENWGRFPFWHIFFKGVWNHQLGIWWPGGCCWSCHHSWCVWNLDNWWPGGETSSFWKFSSVSCHNHQRKDWGAPRKMPTTYGLYRTLLYNSYLHITCT